MDGTKNYIQDIPVFCISIALEKHKQIILGVVYDPVHDELFSAEKENSSVKIWFHLQKKFVTA